MCVCVCVCECVSLALTSSAFSPAHGCVPLDFPSAVWCLAVQLPAAGISSSAAGLIAGTPRGQPASLLTTQRDRKVKFVNRPSVCALCVYGYLLCYTDFSLQVSLVLLFCLHLVIHLLLEFFLCEF